MKEKVVELEQAYQTNGVNSPDFILRSFELRMMIRKYCQEKGIYIKAEKKNG